MKLQFNTNINCGGCIAKVQPFLEEENRIQHWEVDTQHGDKILTVETEELKADEMIALIQNAGFKAELRKKGMLGRLFG